jgi:hypothetical protein
MAIMEALRDAYLDATRILDERLGLLFSIFQENRDWDNTVVVVVSDHGQSFGERGDIFHGQGISSSLYRVPLFTRGINSHDADVSLNGWVSTCWVGQLLKQRLALADSKEHEAGERQPGELNSHHAWALNSGPQGFVTPHSLHGESSSMRSFELLCFLDSSKLVIDTSNGNWDEYDIRSETLRSQGGLPDLRTAHPAAFREAEKILPQIHRLETSSTLSEVTTRLSSWGY